MPLHPPHSKARDDEVIAATCDVALNASDPFGDGDQTKVCPHGNELEQLWARGGDLNPWQPHRRSDYSPFFVACAIGDADEVEACLATADDLRKLIERRESNLRYAPLHVAVAGSRMEAGLPTGSPANSTPQPLGAKANHYKVAKALLDAGCRVDPRDIVGNSPLMLACGTQSSHASVEIGRLLGQRGASLRHVNRFGYPLLYPAATAPDGMGNELCEHVVRTLIELGADPSQRLEMPRPTGSAAAAGPFAEMFRMMSTMSIAQLGQAHGVSPARLAALGERPLPPFAVSASVTFCALKSRAELNGLGGSVTGHGEDGRVHVRIDGTKEEVRVKPENLELLSATRERLRRDAPQEPREEISTKEFNRRMKGIGDQSADCVLAAGCGVVVTGLQSRPDLQGREGVVLSLAEGRAAVRFEGEGAPLRVRTERLAPAVNPSRLEGWPGLPCGARVETSQQGSAGALEWCFQSAVPAGAKMGFQKLVPGPEMTPHTQFVYTLWHVVQKLDAEWPRAVIRAPDDTCGYAIDLLSPPLACPSHVPRSRTSWASVRGQAAGEAPVDPLLHVRYLPLQKRDLLRLKAWAGRGDKQAVTDEPAWAAFIETMPTQGCQTVAAESAVDVSAGLSFLMSMERLLSPSYATTFSRSSQASGAFRPSFLVPPPPPPPPAKAHTTCAMCGVEEQRDARLKKCIRCLSVCYCSKECQALHWKSGHKAVCGKSADQLRASSSEDLARPSVVMSLLAPPEQDGKAIAMMSHTGQGMVSVRLSSTKPPRNIHGDAEFVVKVQVHQQRAAGEPCMVYDEARSFIAHLKLETPGARSLINLIEMRGERNGIKGYLAARREGASLRIFHDRLLPAPAW